MDITLAWPDIMVEWVDRRVRTLVESNQRLEMLYLSLPNQTSVSVKLYVLAILRVMSGRVPPCDSIHSWRFYSAASLADQEVTSTINWNYMQSHYSGTELTSPCPILIMPSARLGLFVALFYIRATYKVWVPTCDSAHSWRLYSAGPLGKQATNTMTWYPTQSLT